MTQTLTTALRAIIYRRAGGELASNWSAKIRLADGREGYGTGATCQAAVETAEQDALKQTL